MIPALSRWVGRDPQAATHLTTEREHQQEHEQEREREPETPPKKLKQFLSSESLSLRSVHVSNPFLGPWNYPILAQDNIFVFALGRGEPRTKSMFLKINHFLRKWLWF